MRCQYCGKNLWPLRGLFDEDFCSKDHRQRYNERVRKALEHLPKGQAGPKTVADFRFEKPRVQDAPVAKPSGGEPWQNPSTPSVPNFAHATDSPLLAASSFSFASVTPAAGGATRSASISATATATAFAPKVMSIETLRERVHSPQSVAATMVEAPAAIAPRAGNMAMKVSERWSVNPQAFDELNHVYLHELDPVLIADFPLAGDLITPIQAVPTVVKPKHTASAGPCGAGRVEFFPMQRQFGGAQPNGADVQDTLLEMAAQEGDNIWLEDFMSWRIPVALAPNRSSLAMLPATDRMAALERVRNTQPASAARPAPLEWRFETADLERRSLEVAGPSVATAIVIEFPAPRERAAAPFSSEVAILDTKAFHLHMPEIAVDAGELDLLLATELADVAPEHADAFGSETNGETLMSRAADWLPLEAKSVLPASSPDFDGALAEPQFADLVAKSLPSEVRNGVESVAPGLAISLPHRAVRLKNGPDFFAAEPVVADSAARPVTARPYAAAVTLAVPEISSSAAGTLLQAVASQTVLPAGAFRDEEVLRYAAQPIQTAFIEVPAVEPQPAGFGSGELTKIDLWFRDAGDRQPHQFDWMAPQLALSIPDSEYEDYPLALQVDVPEPRTVTVFETATYEEKPSKVLPISEVKSKRYAMPSYLKGMAAGLMLASFLWFGSSSIKSDGLTMRPGDLIRLTIQRRATYETGDNFHAGLAAWDGKNFAKSWAYDKEGFIRPGRLALYKPSHDMTDYKMEFLTQIERKGVGWVFRAADDQNYYASKLVVTEPGPRPLVALVRWQVIDGKKEARGETPVQVMMHNNRPYRVEVDVKGNTFLTSIEGQLVDSWSDDRLKSGGVGFFSEGSEKARLYWMKITKNSDFLGKLCSILVPKES